MLRKIRNVSENSEFKFENMSIYVNDTKIVYNIIVINNKTGAILKRGRSEGSNTRLHKLGGTAAEAAD